MSRIKAFRFTWLDAWFTANSGYDAVLETSENGDVSILIRVNREPYKISLTGREDEFIEDMNFLKNWNKKAYHFKSSPNTILLDGTSWELLYEYDDVSIYTYGHEGYPLKFLKFLNIFHQKYEIPVAHFETYLREDYFEHTTIRENVNTNPDDMFIIVC